MIWLANRFVIERTRVFKGVCSMSALPQSEWLTATEAAQLVRGLAAKVPGLRAIDGGKLENIRTVEQITALLIGLNIRHKGHAGIRITGLPPEAYRQ